MSLEKLFIASRSVGKLREIRELFAPARIELLDPVSMHLPELEKEESLERFDTFEQNATAKARYFHALTGLPTVADDSGLAVDALNGAPGVLSKRWSARTELRGQALDDANNEKLLAELWHMVERGGGRAGSQTFPFPARYVCFAAYVDDTAFIVRRGETTGAINAVPRGNGGFGYDPYFESEAVGGTFAEASTEEKTRVSHRGRAFRSLIDALRERRMLG